MMFGRPLHGETYYRIRTDDVVTHTSGAQSRWVSSDGFETMMVQLPMMSSTTRLELIQCHDAQSVHFPNMVLAES